MKIGIDIDNVIANTFADLIPHYERFMKQRSTPQQVIETMRRRKLKMLHYYFMSWQKRVMTTVGLIEGSAETIRQWHPDHQISLVTSRLRWFNRQTQEWLKKHNIPFDELHHAKEKSKHTKAKGCDLFIEDNVEECKILADYCERIFLFDHPWNRKELHKKNIIRVKDWQDIRNKL